MRDFLLWVWFGPWWRPLVGAIYLSILISIIFGPLGGIIRGDRGR